jgi:hypothetical protein
VAGFESLVASALGGGTSVCGATDPQKTGDRAAGAAASSSWLRGHPGPASRGASAIGGGWAACALGRWVSNRGCGERLATPLAAARGGLARLADLPVWQICADWQICHTIHAPHCQLLVRGTGVRCGSGAPRWMSRRCFQGAAACSSLQGCWLDAFCKRLGPVGLPLLLRWWREHRAGPLPLGRCRWNWLDRHSLARWQLRAVAVRARESPCHA